MKFVALWSLKEGVDQAKLAEIMGRRAEHKFPEGMSLIAEYWSSKGSPAVVSIFEEDGGEVRVAARMIKIIIFCLKYFE